MKNAMYAVMLLIGMSIMVCSCQKDNENGGGGNSKLVGTWDWISTVYDDGDEPDDNVGDYIVITDNTITYYYSNPSGKVDNGKPYQYTYDAPHLFIGGANFIDIKSVSSDTMVLYYTYDEATKTYKKRK